jgi:hypothetical protein
VDGLSFIQGDTAELADDDLDFLGEGHPGRLPTWSRNGFRLVMTMAFT